MSVTKIFEQEVKTRFTAADQKNLAIKLVRAVDSGEIKSIIDEFVDDKE